MFYHEPWAQWIQGILGYFVPQGMEQHPWDYSLHFLVSFAGIIVLFLLLAYLVRLAPKTSLAISILFMAALGIFKEYIDPCISLMDLSADALGLFLAIFYCARIVKHTNSS